LTVFSGAILILIPSCKNNYDVKYELTYNVHFPQETVIKTYEFYGNEKATVHLDSWDGTNCIVIVYNGDMNYFFRKCKNISKTSAPIEIVSLEKIN